MGWKELEFRERWSLMVAGIQAVSTFGMLILAVVGIWKVTPIITYQVQQQESELAQMVAQQDTDPLVADALNWWTERMRSYRRVVALIDDAASRGHGVTFEVQEGAAPAVAEGVYPDLLVITATGGPAPRESVSVPVNEKAMSPSQYVQFKLNQGAFSSLPEQQRYNVETAIERYVNRVMLPKVPAILVRNDMSLNDLRLEIAMRENQREEALRHIKGLEEVIAAAREAP